MPNTTRRQTVEPQLQFAAKVIWTIACALGAATAVVGFVSHSKLQVRIDAARAQEQKLQAEGTELDGEAESMDQRVRQLGQEVSAQLNEKYQLHLAMAEVLARARVLQEQQNQFDQLRSAILGHLGKMDQYYERASRQTPGIGSD